MVPPPRRHGMVEKNKRGRRNWSPRPKDAFETRARVAAMSRRVFGGGIWTETNVFSPMPTGLREFVVARPEEGAAGLERAFGGTAFTRFAEVVAAREHEYVQGTYAVAGPAGLTTRAAYESLRDTFLAEVADALPLDCVLLSL